MKEFEGIPKFILRNVRFVTGPLSPPLNLDPGTFMAANLGTKILAKAVGVYQYVAQTREELDVHIGVSYSIIARDGEWCVVDEEGHRGSVPARCLSCRKSPRVDKARCSYSYTRKSTYELSMNVGTELYVLGLYDQWCEVETDGQQGFIPIAYTTMGKLYDNSYIAPKSPKSDYSRQVPPKFMPPVPTPGRRPSANVLYKLETLQNSLPRSEERHITYSPPTTKALSADLGASTAISTRIVHMHTFVNFWKSKSQSCNSSASLKQVVENTTQLEEVLFSTNSQTMSIISGDFKLSSAALLWLDEFCRKNATRISMFTKTHEKSPENVVYPVVRNAIRKNFGSLMKFVTIILENPKVKQVLEKHPILSASIQTKEIENRILNLLS
jgi:hypothetical protein